MIDPTQNASTTPEIPADLIRQINDGNCVAFVGAGFSASVVPPWGDLLKALADRAAIDDSIRSHVANLVAKGSAHAFDEAAQVLEDCIGTEAFLNLLEGLLSEQDVTPMQQRLTWLRGIPFRSILTTNFDPLLPGDIPDADAYRRFLRPEAYRWWDSRYWDASQGAFTLKLHGDVRRGEVVLTRRDYRRQLYSDAAYVTFLRTIMATTTVLYLGFSFSDAYLNELRSEILSLLDQGDSSAPLAYAIVNDVPQPTQDHFLRHEGIHVLSYDTGGAADFSGFDGYLSAIHEQTNPLVRFGRLLADHRILWLDPHPENNGPAFNHLEAAAQAADGPSSPLVTVSSVGEATNALSQAKSASEPFSLLITHWGDGMARGSDGSPCSNAEGLLSTIRRDDVRCPVLVFAGARDVTERKRLALSMGALAYCHTFSDLYRRIEDVLGSG